MYSHKADYMQMVSAYITALLVWPLVIALMIIAIVYVMTIGLISIMAKAIYKLSIQEEQEEVK
jgi:hypothetical protein